MIEILMKAPLFEHVSSDAIFGFLEKRMTKKAKNSRFELLF